MYEIKEIKNTIICGDALEVLKTLPDECVDLIITSPPYYGLRRYGDYEQQIGLEKTFDEFLKKILEITKELKRVLKPSGQFWLNFGDCYASEGKSGGDFGKDGKMTKGLSGRARNSELQSKCLMMMPERIALKMIDEQGWILRNKIKWAKQVLDFKEKKTKGSVMPTSVKDRFNESGEELYFFVKNKKYYSDLDAVRLKNFEPNVERPRIGNNQFQNFNYRVRDAKRKSGQPQFKASEEEIKNYAKGSEFEQKYGEPWDRFGGKTRKAGNQQPKGRSAFLGGSELSDFYKDKDIRGNEMGKNIPTVWLIGSEPHNFQKELGVDTDHFAIFPRALVEIPIKFGCPPGGIVLDCFSGSGTTAVVARKLGRNYIGIELNKEYIKIAEKRLAQEILL